MSKTDRQTDKSTWWSVTAYNDEIEYLEDRARYPNWVAEVHGGRETCPTTGRLHFQGAIKCKSQQRFSAIKKWLPTAHIETARSEWALAKYVKKDETAAGEKLVRTPDTPHYRMDELLMIIAKNRDSSTDIYEEDSKYKDEYWAIVNRIVYDQPRLITAYTIPAVEKAWVQTRNVWIRKNKELSEHHSITGADDEVTEESQLNSPDQEKSSYKI